MKRPPERATSIPSEPWENISLAKYFVIAIVVLLGSMAWALYNEVYTRRPWKSFQREFFALARKKYEKDSAEAKKALASDEYQQLRKTFDDAVKRYEKNPEVLAARKEIEQIDKQLTEVRGKFQLVRGDYQATIYVMDRTADPGAKQRLQQQVDRMEPEVMKLLGEMESLQQKKKEQQDKLTALAQEKVDAEKKMATFETRLRDAELGLDAVKKEQVKIRQVFNDDLKIVDRCQSCHVAADRKGFDDKFKQPFRSHPDVFFLPVEEEKPNGEKKAANGEQQPANGGTPEPPRLRNILAVHEPEKFGCSTCHSGQGFAASSVKDAHGELEFVLTPLLRGEFAQSSCVKCHKQETELPGAPTLNEGRRIVVEYGCIGCHTFAQLTPEEANRQVAPDLKEIRKKLISPEWLVNWIEEPEKFRPTTKMPHFSLTRDQAVQVASYLWQNAEKPSQDAPPAATFPANQIQAGDVLVENVGCFACHAMYDKKGESNFAPHLGRVGEKLRYDYMVSWLMDPKQHQKEGRMPRLRLTRQEASNIAAYLTTKRTDKAASEPVNLDDPKAAEQGKLLIEHYGCSGCHPIEGMEKRGKIGAELSQFGSKPVEQLDYGLLEKEVLHRVHLHHARDNVLQARIAWVQQKLKDPRSYDRGRYKKFKDKLRMPNFGFNEKQIKAIATFLMGLTDEKVPAEWQHRLDERKEAVAKGLRIIRRQNCIGCHQLKLETLTFARDNGKTYHLEGTTKIEEQGTIFFQLWKDMPSLGRASNEMQPVPDPEHPTDRILSRTSGWGGDIVSLIIDQWVKKASLAPEEARTYAPPMLIGEGRKVQSPWLFDFLKEPVILRPWLQVRMPTFDLSDEDAAAVVRYFAAVDGGTFPYRRVPEREHAYIAAKRSTDPTYYTRALGMMTSEDIKCFSCHVRGAQKPEGNPSDWAPDLSLAQKRLQSDWIVGWLNNPSGIYPGTKMPKFPFGEFQQLFPGSANKQMSAIKDLIMSGQLSTPTIASAKR